jgi:hypothetical protein
MLPFMNTNPTKSWRYKLGRYLLKFLGFHIAMIKISDGSYCGIYLNELKMGDELYDKHHKPIEKKDE